jgi:transposase InsO family protein
MGQKVVTMETKLAAMLADVGSGMRTVGEALQISRQTFYKYRKRFLLEGPPGLIEKSRRPLTSPTQTCEELVAVVLTLRHILEEEGWDNGATSIFYRMQRDGHQLLSRRTIHRLLVRAGVVVPQPGKRPRSSYRSFQVPATDDCWQLDAWEFTLAGGEKVVIFELKDDRSRYLVNVMAWPAETTAGAWQCVSLAIADYGKPGCLLNDNSLAFTGRLYGIEVEFEKNLRRHGIQAIHASPKHPQTCGKNERGHQTAQKWLTKHPTPATVAELQQLLDQYRVAFNNRPHQALDGNTPLEQRAASSRITPRTDGTVAAPTIITTPTASSRGAIGIGKAVVGLGVEYAGEQMIVFNTDDHVEIYYRQYLVHTLTLDKTRTYQQPRRPRSGPRRHPRAGDLPPIPSSTTATPAGDAAAVKMQPPTGGTILTAASPGIPSPVEEHLSAMS